MTEQPLKPDELASIGTADADPAAVDPDHTPDVEYREEGQDALPNGPSERPPS